MSEIKQITVSVGGTLNLGNYNNAKVEVAVTVEPQDGDADGAYSRARDFCAARLRAEFHKAQNEEWPA